jgi:hypothetical protein
MATTVTMSPRRGSPIADGSGYLTDWVQQSPTG